MSILPILARGGTRLRAAEAPPPPVTTVAVSPASFSIEVGETQQLTINVENPMGPTDVQSSDTGVATVDSSGLVTGVAEGSVTITATNNGVSDTASGTVMEAVDPGAYIFGPGANEPSGLAAFMSYDPGTHGIDISDAHGDGYSGGTMNGDSEWNDGRMTIVADAGTPGGFALRQEWPTGQDERSGNAGWGWGSHVPDPDLYPGWSGALGALSRLYARFTVYVPSDWTMNPGNAKFIGFTMQDEVGSNNLDTYLQHRSGGDLWYRFQCQANGGADNREFEATAGQTDGPGRGTWHEFEIYLVAQSAPGAADGEFHVWMDGQKATQWRRTGDDASTDGTGRQFLSSGAPGTGFTAINVFPYYNGGSEAPKPKTEHLLWGGLYLSGA